jgi:hypothetical protein
MKIINGIVIIAITLIFLGFGIPLLWPYIEDSAAAIGDMSGGDFTTITQLAWPVMLVITAICIGIGIIYWVLKQIGVIGGKK